MNKFKLCLWIESKRGPNNIWLILGCLIVLTIGCQSTKKFDVYLTEGQLTFGNKKIVKEVLKGRGYMLSDIEVKRLDCDNDCVMWSMVRERDPINATSNDIRGIMGEILYGRRIAGMVERVEAKNLVAGEYVVTATLEVAGTRRRPGGASLLRRRFGIQRLGSAFFEIVYLD